MGVNRTQLSVSMERCDLRVRPGLEDHLLQGTLLELTGLNSWQIVDTLYAGGIVTKLTFCPV